MKEKTEQIVNNSLTDLVAGVRVSTMLTGGSDLASYGTIAYNNNYSLLTLNRIILTYLYTSSGIFQTAIDLPTQDALSRGIEIESDQMNPADIDELLDFMEESGQWTSLLSAWNWARLYGGSGLVINTNQEPKDPLNYRTLNKGPLELYDADRWQFDNAHPYAGDFDEMLFGKPPDHFYLYGQQIHEITEMLIANMGQYAHGNQPIQHGIYLYNYAGQPWKTQKWVRKVDSLYL